MKLVKTNRKRNKKKVYKYDEELSDQYDSETTDSDNYETVGSACCPECKV